MNVFLTGATGFIGRHLAPALAGRGHRVLCLVRDPARAAWMKEHRNLEPVPGDLSSPGVIARSVARSQLVYHLAGRTRAVRTSALMEVNGTATGRLAEAAAAASRPPRVVYVSSLAAVGPSTSRNPAGDACEPSPMTAYGESKLLGERLLRERMPGGGWTIVRPPAVYGPWDRDVLFLFRLASRGIILQVSGGVREVSVIHVSDLVEALILAGESPAAAGRILHVSDGRIHHRDDVASALRKAFGRGWTIPVPSLLMRAVGLAGDAAGLLTGRPVLLNGDKVRESLQPGWVCSSSAIAGELGFSPKIGLEEGFRSTLEWYRQAGWL